jgi:hypothetical protein
VVGLGETVPPDLCFGRLQRRTQILVVYTTMKVQVFEVTLVGGWKELVWMDLKDKNHWKHKDGTYMPRLVVSHRMIWDMFWTI